MVFWMMNFFIKPGFVCGFRRHLSQPLAGAQHPCPSCLPLGQGSLARGAMDPFGNQKVALVLPPETAQTVRTVNSHFRRATGRNPCCRP